MFVVSYSRKAKGQTYSTTYLAESYRNAAGKPTHKHLLNISHLPADKIDGIKAVLQGKTVVDWDALPGLEALDFGLPFLTLGTLATLGFPQVLPPPLQAHWSTLAAMIVNRVDRPCAKYSVKHWLPRTAVARLLDQASPAFVHHDVCYETLDRLQESQTGVEDALFARRPSPPTLYLYDLTSTYFEGEKAELGAYGYSRDHRQDRKQITIGFLGDMQGLPLAVEVFEGNTRDSATVAAQVEKMKARFGCQKACFVGDRGMMTVDNVTLLRDKGMDFILALTHREVLKLVEAHGPRQMGLEDEQGLADITLDGRRLIVCRNPVAGADTKRRRKELMALTEARFKMLADRVQAGRLKQAVKIQQAVDRFVSKWGMEKFYRTEVAEGQFTWQVDQKTLEAAARLDGVYVLEATPPASEVEGVKVQMIYKNLQEIERAFECLKSEVRVRPVFHWRERRIRAHVYLCTLAYLVEQTWRNAWEAWPPADRPEWTELMGALRAWRRVYVPGKPSLKPKDVGLTPEVAAFFAKVGVPLP